MKKNYEVGDRIFYEFYNGGIMTARIKEIQDRFYTNSDGKRVDYKMFKLVDGGLIEDYSCLSPNSSKCADLLKFYKKFDKEKNKLVESIVSVLKDYMDISDCVLDELIEEVKFKLKEV